MSRFNLGRHFISSFQSRKPSPFPGVSKIHRYVMFAVHPTRVTCLDCTMAIRIPRFYPSEPPEIQIEQVFLIFYILYYIHGDDSLE